MGPAREEGTLGTVRGWAGGRRSRPLAAGPAASRPREVFPSCGDLAHSCLRDAVAQWMACDLSLTEPVPAFLGWGYSAPLRTESRGHRRPFPRSILQRCGLAHASHCHTCGLRRALFCMEAVPPMGSPHCRPQGLGGHAVRTTPGLPRW